MSFPGRSPSRLYRWKAQLDDFKDRTAELAENFVSFNMPLPPRFDGLLVAEAEVMLSATSWNMLQSYLLELEELKSHDWIGFRNNMHALYDIISTWSDKLKQIFANGRTDAVIMHLASQLEQIKAAVPALKYCHGSDFKDEHWSALLQGKLALGKGVKIETLTVGHFISALDQLADPTMLAFVKQLQVQAQGEVLIREALQELAVWSQTANLSLVDHEEQGKHTKLIKNWKNLFVDLGDKQSLLASLKESQFYRAFEDVGEYLVSSIKSLCLIVNV